MMRAPESEFTAGLRHVAQSSLLLIAVLLLTQGTAWSGEWSEENFPAWPTVSDDELETVRGGFLFSNGVQVDIGIQKAAFVNGVEQFRTQFDVSEGLQNKILNEANSVLQIGTGNSLNGLEIPAGSTFIQNTLDNQLLGNFTVVDVRIKNLDAMQQQTVPAFPSIQDFAIPGIAP